jgi:hypothetical protein
VVYDEKLLELGYEVVVEDQPKPKAKKPTDDEVSVEDKIDIRLFKGAA